MTTTDLVGAMSRLCNNCDPGLARARRNEYLLRRTVSSVRSMQPNTAPNRGKSSMRRVPRVFVVSVITLAAGAAAAQTAPNGPGATSPNAPTNPAPNAPPTNAAPNSNATTPAAATAPDQPQGTAQPMTPPPAAPVAAQPPQTAPPGTPPVAVQSAPTQAILSPSMGTDRVNPEAPLESGPVPMKGKWNPVLYGFVEFDSIHDSTQSFSDLPGNGVIANPHAANNYQGTHDRTTFAIRNSRIGFKLSAPETDGIKTSGIVEMDFLGNQPSNPLPSATGTAAVSEGGFFTSPTFRVRHMALKLEDPYVDVLLGQYWQLFGWQSYFHPNTVTLQGVPGQVYSRAAQARLSHLFKSEPVNFEIAVAASRPPQRDSGVPDGQAGIRLLVNDLKGVHTMGGTGTAIDAAGVGFSGVVRRFRLPSYEQTPTTQRSTTGWGISTDVLIPIALGGKSIEDHGNNLTLTGSWVLGRGIADLFTGLSDGNTAAWPLPNPTGATPAPTYAPNVNIDPGLVEFDSVGNPRAIRWQVFMGGVQYYLPPTGKLWVAFNYSHMKSNNILDYLPNNAKAAVFTSSEWYDANLFYDVTVAARLGVEYAHYKQTYGDGTHRNNDHAQFSGWLIF